MEIYLRDYVDTEFAKEHAWKTEKIVINSEWSDDTHEIVTYEYVNRCYVTDLWMALAHVLIMSNSYWEKDSEGNITFHNLD